jgi:hypothetical protein
MTERLERAVREVEQANGGEIPPHSLLDWELANPEEPMTDPLIDRDALCDVFFSPSAPQHPVDAILDYLRSVLTPEVLWKHMLSSSGGDDLHRRIFGEDK